MRLVRNCFCLNLKEFGFHTTVIFALPASLKAARNLRGVRAVAGIHFQSARRFSRFYARHQLIPSTNTSYCCLFPIFPMDFYRFIHGGLRPAPPAHHRCLARAAPERSERGQVRAFLDRRRAAPQAPGTQGPREPNGTQGPLRGPLGGPLAPSGPLGRCRVPFAVLGGIGSVRT